MTKIVFLINTNKSPLKDQWFQEFSVQEVKYSAHYFDSNLFPKDLDHDLLPFESAGVSSLCSVFGPLLTVGDTPTE